jgi:hypothetical protein
MDEASGWGAGYITDIEYTFGYYREQCPALLRLACLSAGVLPPKKGPISYLELGYGQGLSLNIHAAANCGSYWGTDFNPTQAAHARGLASASGANIKLFDDSFAEFASRPDIPEFDVITLHGIWTWISDENKRVIVDLIRRKLKVGGLVYISYNCLPGWAPAMPLRHLMKLHADFAGSESTAMVAKVDAALSFAKQVLDSGALYFVENPAVAQRLTKIATQNKQYLAHEYLNKEWRLMAFAELAEWLELAKLSFAGSAFLIDHVDTLNLSSEGQKLLDQIANPILRQSVRDYFVNQQFRRDIFVKGPQRMTPIEQQEAFCAESFVLLTPGVSIPREVSGSSRKATLAPTIYDPIIAALEEDGGRPKSVEWLRTHQNLTQISLPQITQALLVLAGSGHVHPTAEATAETRTKCRDLNRYILRRSRTSADINFLASPVTGGGVLVTRFEQLFLLGREEGKNAPREQAEFAWRLMDAQGQRLVKEGKTLETREDNLDELAAMAEEFAKRIPLMAALGIA